MERRAKASRDVVQSVAKPAEPVSGWWWLIPFFLAWIGGLINYFVLKDRNRKTARNMLIFGIIWTFVGIVFVVTLGYALVAVFYWLVSKGIVPSHWPPNS